MTFLVLSLYSVSWFCPNRRGKFLDHNNLIFSSVNAIGRLWNKLIWVSCHAVWSLNGGLSTFLHYRSLKHNKYFLNMIISSHIEVSLAFCLLVKVSFGMGRWWFMWSLWGKKGLWWCLQFQNHPRSKSAFRDFLGWNRNKAKETDYSLFVSLILTDYYFHNKPFWKRVNTKLLYF